MRVLHIITGLGVGGAEQQLRLLLRRLPVDCDVVTLTNPGPVADGMHADGVSVTHLGMSGNRDLTALPRLTRLIRRGRYDLVHTHLYRACVYGRIAARLAYVRATVATEHSLGERYIEGRPLTRSTRELYLRTERLGSATVAVSATVADRLRGWGVPARRIHVVPNGIDGARFRHDSQVRAATRALLDIPSGAFVVGGVGRLVPGKRFDLLVRAVAALPGVRLLLAGDGPERGRCGRSPGGSGPVTASTSWASATRCPTGRTPVRPSPPSWTRWTSSSPRPMRSPSGSPSSRRWPLVFPSCTRPAPRSTTCPRRRCRARCGCRAAPGRSRRHSAAKSPWVYVGWSHRRWSAATTSRAAPTVCSGCTPASSRPHR